MIYIIMAVTAFLFGFFLTVVFTKKENINFQSVAFAFACAYPLGTGIVSLLHFWVIKLTVNSFIYIIYSEILFILVTFILGFLTFKKIRTISFTEEKPSPAIFFIMALTALIFFIAALIVMSVKEPFGGWDAWAFWNTKANFLSFAGAEWSKMFSPELFWTNTDYPLLIPSAVSRLWIGASSPDTVQPVINALFFAISAVMIIAAAGAEKGRMFILSGVIFVVSSYVFTEHSASQYSDVPLSALLASAVFFSGIAGNKGNPVLTGIFTALLAWTKNEGMLYVAAILITLVLFYGKSGIKSILLMLAGFIPVIIPILVFKESVFTSGWITQGSPSDKIAMIINPQRHILIIYTLIRETIAYSGGIIFFLFAFSLTGGIIFRKAVYFIVFLAVCFAGFYSVYLTTPYDVLWHIGSSYDRLLSQLWPSLVLTVMLLYRKEIRLTNS